MVLESCMILLDNSEYMRNGDYIPSRLEAQHDAANFLVGAKTQSNPENTVGVIAMCGGTSFSGSGGGSSPGELLVSPTDDMAKILSALHGIPIRKGCHSLNFSSEDGNDNAGNVGKGGGVDLIVSLQVANLALKHRRNKNGGQRVIVFVGSPLTHVDSRALTRAGRMLKKNNLAIDVIAMGELEENEGKLKDLVDAANGSSASSAEDGAGERTCHLVTIPAGVLPSDVLVSSPIVHGGADGISAGTGGISAGASSGTGGGGGFAEFGGVDPNMDPELAMALRVSMEEERARQERAAAAAASSQENDNDGSNNDAQEDDGGAMEVDSSPAANVTTATDDVGFEVSEDDALLQQALAMSMTNGNDTSTATTPAASTETTTAPAATANNTSAPDEDMIDEEDEDAAMQLALQMSMQPDAEDESPPPPKADESASSSQQFQDPQFVNQLLGTLPSGESNDAVRNILDKNRKDGDDKKDEEKK